VSTIKTSISHPLAVFAVMTPGGGKIGMTLCPGKCQPQAVTGPWQRDLALDVAAIKAFGADLLITLMEADELIAAAVPGETLRASVLSAGLDWLHLPIADFQAPDQAFEHLWAVHGTRVRGLLQTGKHVVLHCRGGRGRSGMIAARLLVEIGAAPEAAIAGVRSVNPLAMETSAQEAHVRACRLA
jgi:protein-tyrosine phosphatase